MRFHALSFRTLRRSTITVAGALALALAVVASDWAAAQLPPDPDSARALDIGVADGFTVAAVGDLIISHPVSHSTDARFTEMVQVLQRADITFGNFENTAIDIRYFDGFPAAQYGGLRLRVAPEAAHDLKTLGFDLVARANNHTTDWGVEGLRATNEVLDEAGIVHAGSGQTMAAARAGRYLETPKGRVAVVSMATSFTAMSQAMDPLGEVRGRPGLSSLRTTRHYWVTEEEMEVLLRIRDAQPRPRPREGETQDELSLFGVRYRVGDQRGVSYEMNQADVRAILHAISEAKRNSDFVIATIHAHNPGNWSDEPPEFLESFARMAIDAGADQFVGHGPHQLRGIEIYQGKPIFYSLGNFFFQVDLQSPLSRDIFDDFGVNPEDMADGELLRRWMDRGFDDPIWYESVITESRFEGGQVAEIRLYPVELGYGLRGANRGQPRLARPEGARKILETLQRLAEPYGTEVRIENGVGVIRLSPAATSSGSRR